MRCERSRDGHFISTPAPGDSLSNGRLRHTQTTDAAVQILGTRERQNTFDEDATAKLRTVSLASSMITTLASHGCVESSLQAIIGRIRELKNTTEIAEMVETRGDDTKSSLGGEQFSTFADRICKTRGWKRHGVSFRGHLARGCRLLLHQAGAPRVQWAEAITFISEGGNATKRKTRDTTVEPLLLTLGENDENAESAAEGHRVESWPPRGCPSIATPPASLRARQCAWKRRYSR